MWRIIFLTSMLSLTSVMACSAQSSGFGARPSMTGEEASLITDYWFRSYLRRAPAPAEHRYWTNQLMHSSPAHALSALLGGEDYFQYAGGTMHGLVRQLIADVGHREASAYEVEDRMRYLGGRDDPRNIALSFLRDYPRNWWPGPTASPPRELQYFYRGAGRPYWR